MKKRLSDFLSILKSHHLDGFIVTNPTNIFYLCGFHGVSPTERESILIFSPRVHPSKPSRSSKLFERSGWRSGATLIAPRLYQSEAQTQASVNLRVKIVSERNQLFQTVERLLRNAQKIGFEEEDLKYSEFKMFKKILHPSNLRPFKDLIENLRVLKNEEEIKRIQKAQIISQLAFEKLLKTIKNGQTEEEIADKLSKIIKSLRGQGLAFESIVASGKNAALPHYITGKKKIKNGEVLLLDFGAKYQNYCADLSRTIFLGRAPDQLKNIYSHIYNAQTSAISNITPQRKTSHVFNAANNVFKKHNLDKYFLHSLGHGIGLEVHEKPHLRPFPKDLAHREKMIDEELLENMVFSVEPGLYFPEWGGIRIEDLVVIRNGKAKVLGKQLANLIEIN